MVGIIREKLLVADPFPNEVKHRLYYKRQKKKVAINSNSLYYIA
jgi:hypothetical protein